MASHVITANNIVWAHYKWWAFFVSCCSYVPIFRIRTNNMFQIDSQSRIALKYNDVQVPENFHIEQPLSFSKDKYAEMFPKISDLDSEADSQKSRTLSVHISKNCHSDDNRPGGANGINDQYRS